jgi:putative oxidoreductase
VKSFLFHKYLVLAVRLFFGGVFIIASIEKIAYPETFAISVEAYKVLPISFINIFSLVIPWMELLCGVFLLGGVFLRASASLLTLFLGMFTVAILSAMMRQLNIDCGCFGPAHSTPVGWNKILEDFGLIVLGIYLFLASGDSVDVHTSSTQHGIDDSLHS